LHQTLQSKKNERKVQAMKNQTQEAILTSLEEVVGRWALREVPTTDVFFKCLEARVGVPFTGGTINDLVTTVSA
jgi:hypothetical protein